jgi:hypothetical protein
MTALTRRRGNNRHQETWYIYYGDVRVGTISTRAGVPTSADQWGWSLGFYPGTEPGTHRSGTGGTFEDARATFERAWKEIETTLTEENYERWRYDRDATAWKYRMWDSHCRMPTQNRNGRSRCFCGAEITIAGVASHVRTAHRGIGIKR